MSLPPNGSFTRGVAILLGGTAGAQSLSVLAAPLLTRLYTPEDYGTLAVFTGLLALIGALSTLYYIVAIPLPEEDAEAANIAALCLTILIGVTGITALVSLFFSESIAAAFGVPRLAKYLWLLPIGVFLGGAYSIFRNWAVRSKRYSDIATTSFSQAIATLAIQLAGHKFGVGALIVGRTAGQGVGSIRLAQMALKNPAFRGITRRDMASAASRHRRFPLYLSWAGFFDMAGAQLPPLMFAAIFSAGAAGFYNLAYRVLALPIAMVGSAVGSVFSSDAPAAHRAGALGPLVGTVHDKLAQIAMPPMALVAVAGPDIFAVVFGEGWREAGTLARWMAPMLYVMFCDSGLRVFIITGHQQLSLIMHGIQLAVRVAAIAVGALYGGFVLAVVLFSLGSTITYAVFIYLKLRIAKSDLAAAAKSHLKALFLSLICIAPLVLAIVEAPHTIPLLAGLVAFVVLTTARYVLLYWREY